jgi:hypothetical protein
MTLPELMDALYVLRVSLSIRLVVDAPAGVITPEIRQSLADHKTEIVARLAQRDSAPLPRYWTAPNLTPADVDAIQAIRELIWDGTSLTESIEAGRQWNAAVGSRPGNPEKEKSPKRSSGRPQWSAEDQEAREAERERQRENMAEVSDPETLAFLAAVEEKHRAYWAARPHGGNVKLLFDLKRGET